MSFSARLTRAPRAFDPKRAAEARALFPEQPAELRELLGGTAGCSGYLLGLMEREAEWLRGALEAPEAARDGVLTDVAGAVVDGLGSALRQAKRRMALLVALADLGGVWALEEVTGSLTALADAACARALRSAVEAEARRKRLPGLAPADIDGACGGLFALAMGKMGAHELNYSSDIDLICLFDETRFDASERGEARAGFVRAVRAAMALISENTAEGYVFRTDLRLRPDAAVTPIVMAAEAAERYYESFGRTWERAAYVKARACAGDVAAGSRFLAALTPFVWRRHLDFAAIQDAHDMRLRIREHKGLGGPITLAGHDVKLGRGGIREIEFFTQTRQIIAGGRDPELRCRGTLAGLAALGAKGWVPGEVVTTLTAHYRALRELEHRLQMIADAQTHALPSSDEGFERLVAFTGQERAAWEAELRARLEEVHALTEDFFAPSGSPGAGADEVGFDTSITERWPSYPALRSTRAVEIFERVRPALMSRLARAARPEEALAQFDRFLAGLPAGVQLFALFEANPPLVDLIVDIAATSSALAEHLSQHPGTLDAVLGGSFFAPWPGAASLREELARLMAGEADYERKLDAARRWKKEWHFRIGVHHLRALATPEEVGAQYADLAEATLAALWPAVTAEFSVRHGPPPGRGAVVLALGSLGAGRLHATSDLDLIVIYDAQGAEVSEGRRPLPPRTYFARLTQALLTALTAPMAEGRLYEADMRLRPSGRQGPVATSWAAFRSYQREEAWTWEHLALTRARTVAGPPELAADVESFRREIIAGARDRAALARDLCEMRDRLRAAKPPHGRWDAKLGPGRLQEIELAGQAAALTAGLPERALAAQLGAGDFLTKGERAALLEAQRFFWALQAVSRLLSSRPLDLGEIGLGACEVIWQDLGLRGEAALAAAYAAHGAAAAAAMDAALARAGAPCDG